MSQFSLYFNCRRASQLAEQTPASPVANHATTDTPNSETFYQQSNNELEEHIPHQQQLSFASQQPQPASQPHSTPQSPQQTESHILIPVTTNKPEAPPKRQRRRSVLVRNPLLQLLGKDMFIDLILKVSKTLCAHMICSGFQSVGLYSTSSRCGSFTANLNSLLQSFSRQRNSVKSIFSW